MVSVWDITRCFVVLNWIIGRFVLLWRLPYNSIKASAQESATKPSSLLLPPLIHPESTYIRYKSDCLENCCPYLMVLTLLGLVCSRCAKARLQDYKITLFVWLLLVRQSLQQYCKYFWPSLSIIIIVNYYRCESDLYPIQSIDLYIILFKHTTIISKIIMHN